MVGTGTGIPSKNEVARHVDLFNYSDESFFIFQTEI